MKNRKNILIVINSMELGGAQKSLASFLRCLEQKNAAGDYEIDLLVAKPSGLFMNQIPAFVHQLDPVPELLWAGTARGDEMLKQYPCFRGRLGKLLWILTGKQKLLGNRLNDDQRLWKNWKHLVPRMEKHYDTAIAYMNGFPAYYVIDKVQADHKVLWIHNEYQKIGYDRAFDAPYYAAADRVVTISDICVESFVQIFPEYQDKITVLQNITLEEDVLEKGARKEAPEFEQEERTKILSVGRLAVQKQFELSVLTAEALAKRHFPFLWLIVGEGSEGEMLQSMIDERHLQDSMQLIGLRQNPYAYMARCDVFVQTSRFEGKSIVLDEAKVFRKPLVVTNYPTAKDTITNGENGLICGMDASELADAIIRVGTDPALRRQFAEALNQSSASDAELQQYLQKMMRW